MLGHWRHVPVLCLLLMSIMSPPHTLLRKVVVVLTIKTLSLTLVHLVSNKLVALIGRGGCQKYNIVVQPKVHFLTYLVGFGPSNEHTIGLLILLGSSWLTYHRIGGFEGMNPMDLDSFSLYYVGFVGHCFAGYRGVDYPTFHLDFVDFYHKIIQEDVGFVGNYRMVTSRGPYNNFHWGDYPHIGCTLWG